MRGIPKEQQIDISRTRRISVLASLFLLIGACSSTSLTMFPVDDSDNPDDTDDTDDTDSPDTDMDGMISDVSITVHDQIKTILVVSWSQDIAADQVWIEFTFENNEWNSSPQKSGETGRRSEVILGVPENTDVTLRIKGQNGYDTKTSRDYNGTTGSVPSDMPRPTIEIYEHELASSHRWLFGTVDDTASPDEAYSGPFWAYIIDRQGRIVWYFADLEQGPIMNFSRISRDNRYIYLGSRRWSYNQIGIYEMNLDLSYYEYNKIAHSDCFDVMNDGSLLYDTYGIYYYGKGAWLVERDTNGKERYIWDCWTYFKSYPDALCYTNTVNWNPNTDTVTMSFPYMNTVAEIDRASGDVVGVYGQYGDYAFSPSSWSFGFQHYANITSEGTLMVSTHMSDEKTHAFAEFYIDRGKKVLTEKWSYTSKEEWPEAMGEAHVVPGGSDNVLGNYGTAGVIKEITRDKQIAWQVKFDANWDSDFTNKMVGHCQLIDDLYALNQGP